jgi:hypothetical protein
MCTELFRKVDAFLTVGLTLLWPSVTGACLKPFDGVLVGSVPLPEITHLQKKLSLIAETYSQ